MSSITKICEIEGCNRLLRYPKYGWCQKHYDKWKSHSDPLWERPPLKMVSCKINGCDRVGSRKGMCTKHYQRVLWHDDPLQSSIMAQASTLPEYKVWQMMLQRCYNSKVMNYRYWGGRGITVCERWQSSFLLFIYDMGKRPSDKHSIDRIDNDGNYEPSNCRWATRAEQRANQRKRLIVAS